jgi:hypothetical protein
MRVGKIFTFAYCEIIPKRIPFEKKEKRQKSTVHTSQRPLIKVKYQSAHDKTYQKMSHSHIPQNSKAAPTPPEKNSLKSLCMAYLERGGKSNKHFAFYVTLRTQPQLAILLGRFAFFFVCSFEKKNVCIREK